MKKIHLFLLAALTTATFIGCNSNKTVSSPDGAVKAQIVQENDQLALKVFLYGSEAAQWQIGGISFEKEEYDFTGKLKQKGVPFMESEITYPVVKRYSARHIIIMRVFMWKLPLLGILIVI